MSQDSHIATKSKIPLYTVKQGSALAVQTFYMVALKNHIKLSGMADRKANLILAVCALLISAILTNSLKFVQETGDQYLLFPTIIFVLFMLVAMILSIITTIPKVTSGTFNREAVEAMEVNLSFFGNFHKMKLEEYEWAVKHMQQEGEEIYKVLTKDLYFLGKVLDKKFRLLNITYGFLIVGVVLSVAVYIWAFYKHN
ncbi:Pycsar system effector family protein [Rasiella sp. SM2506]|uniref:Pycsar system effector family protein n=1 Tax=Rasiella sp. SM2506 TaxID=3423914 RepID=UPI003D7A0E7E